MRWIVICLIFSSQALATKVLLIQSYHSGYSWDASYIEGIKQTLLPSIEFETFQMDTKRLPMEQFERKAEQAFAAYQEFKPDIVMLGDDNALNYMLPKLYDEPVSIVFLGINSNPRAILKQYQGQANVTGVLERPLFVKSLGELRNVFATKEFKVLILFDSGVTSHIAKSYIDNQYTMIRQNLGIDVEIKALATRQAWRNQVVSAKQKGFTVIIVGLYQTLVDEYGENVHAEEVIEWTSQNSPLPIFAFWDFAVGAGKAAGGVVLFGHSHGVEAAEMVNQLAVQGASTVIPIATGNQGKAIYSKSELSRWGLNMPPHWQQIE